LATWRDIIFLMADSVVTESQVVLSAFALVLKLKDDIASETL